MATFNTAFGSLPTPKQELFGNTPTAQTKPKATGQIEQDIAPGATMNFADLQKNGRARPAPPPAQMAPPPMLSSLQEQLRQPVAPVVPEVRTTVPPMLGALQASFMSEAPSGEGAGAAGGETGVTTSPVPVDARGTTPVATPITGLVETTGAGEPEVRGRDEVGGPGYTPGRPDRTPPPPVNAPANAPWYTQGNPDLLAQWQWMTTNNVPRIPDGFKFIPPSQGGPRVERMTFDEMTASGFSPYGGRTLYDNENNRYLMYLNNKALYDSLGYSVPKPAGYDEYLTRFGAGNPPIVDGVKTPEELEQLRRSGGGYTGGGTPGTVSYQPTGTGTAGLPDINGLLARLSGTLTTGGGTPATAGTPAFAGSPQALALRQKLEAQLAKLASGDDAQRKAFEATRAARGAELTAQYGAERSKLEEELARRGISASTIGGGRYGDLAGQQARATASFEAEMLKQQSEAEARDRALYMSTMSDLAGMAGTQDLGAYEANLKTKQIEADIGFRAAELQQEAALKGRDLSLQEARDRATAQYQSGQLGLGYAEMRSREQMQREDQTFRAGESALERQLRLSLQANDIKAQADLAKLDRDLRSQIASGELTLNQGIAVSNIAQRIFDGTLPIEAWDTLLRSLGIDPAKYPKPQPRVSGGGGGGGGVGGSGGSGGSGGGSAGDGSKF